MRNITKKYYEQAKGLLVSNDIKDIIRAKSLFESLSTYENAELYICRCDNRIKELKSAAEKTVKSKKILKISAIIAPFAIVGIILYAIFIPPLMEYRKAVDNYNNGLYEEAYSYFKNSSYGDSGEMSLKCQYAYVKENYDNYNETTYEYLKNLKSEGYKDSIDLYDELYKWTVELKCINTKSDDYSTIADSIAKDVPYLHYAFLLTGGKPSETETFYNKVIHPDGQSYKSSWYWENYSSGAELGCEWAEGFKSSSGTVTFEIYSKDNDEFIGSASIRVK